MAGLFDLSSFTGSLEITSTKPIVSLSINAEAAPVFSSLPPGEIPASTDRPFNQQQTERLIGTWKFDYTIISEFTQTYRLSDVRENPDRPGEWVIWGTDQYGDPVEAGYSPRLKMFSLLDRSVTIHRYFTFDFVGSDRVSGCYYQIDADDGSRSRCYDMTGVRTHSTGLTRLTSAPLSTTTPQEERGKVEEVERLEVERLEKQYR